jgi:hypothetical protein
VRIRLLPANQLEQIHQLRDIQVEQLTLSFAA